MVVFDSRSVSLRQETWEQIDFLIEKGKGTFRNRSHVIEYILQQQESLDNLVEQVRKDGQA